MENNPPSYTLEDLSAETGFDTRVIRSFIEQGLLRGPTSLGRYARYSDRHLVRLLAIKALKENRGLKLSDTRQTLLCMSEPEIDALAETVRRHKANPPASALDYLRSLKLQVFDSQPDQVVQQVDEQRHEYQRKMPPAASTSDPHFDSSADASVSVRQMPASETWHRFQITPDVELSVRGLQTDQQMARMKNVAKRLREYLIGGPNE